MMLLASRDLFSNWLEAGFRYFLVKHGLLAGGVVVKCGGMKYVLSPSAYHIIIRAYYEGVIEGVECRDSLYTVFTYMGRRIHLYKAFEFLYDIVFENFYGGVYSGVDVGGKTVVDVGAGVGDTAILFSLMGARRVVALEPYPALYRKALVNARINGFEDRVLLVNAGVGSSDEEVCADLRDVHGYYVFRSSGRCDTKVRIYTLSSLVRGFKIEAGSILKVDCEGCEYDVLLNAKPEDIRVFEQIIIEYHNGYKEIRKLLEDLGYETIIKPMKTVSLSLEKQGYIVASLWERWKSLDVNK